MPGRGRLVLSAGALAAGIGFSALPGQAATLRSGLARAQVARIVPYVGIPSVGAGVGVAQAEVTGGRAHASAGLADFGAMSLILGQLASKAPVPLPDLPAPITADDRDHPDIARDPVAPPAVAPPAPATPAAAHEEAHASGAPASRALVRGPELGVPGALTFTAGQSEASADGGASASSVHLGRVVLGGAGGVPEVVLSDLVWTARQAMGRPGSATFTIGAATVAGLALPVPAAAPPADVLKAVNDALAPFGPRLEAPVSTADAAGAAVSALVIQVRNPEAVANLAAGAAKPAVPVLNQVLDSLVAAAPDAAASRLVVNALLATGTTRGGGRLELGGAAARIGNVEVADLTPAPPPLESSPLESADPGSTDNGSTGLPPFTADGTAPVPGTPAPPADLDSGSDPGDPPFPGPGSLGASDSLAAPASPIAPSGAAHALAPPAAPDGRPVKTRPLGSTGPGGAPAPLVLAAALLAVIILAAGDKLRLRRITG